jgi:hypothetical protein
MQYNMGNESSRNFPTRGNRLIVACPKTVSGQLPKHSLHLITFQLVPRTLLEAIVRVFLATKSFVVGSLNYPCHEACISKSVPKDVLSLIGCCTTDKWVPPCSVSHLYFCGRSCRMYHTFQNQCSPPCPGWYLQEGPHVPVHTIAMTKIIMVADPNPNPSHRPITEVRPPIDRASIYASYPFTNFYHSSLSCCNTNIKFPTPHQ